MPGPKYIPIPVEVAAGLGSTYGKQVVVIVAWDGTHEILHVTTWGRDALHKDWAANLGAACSMAAGADIAESRYFEDFRASDAAVQKETIERLTAEIEKLKAGKE